MIGGKLLPLHGDLEPNLPNHFRDWFKSWWNQNSAIYFFLKILIKPRVGNTLGQSASWRPLFGGFPPLARGLNWLVAPRPKGLFLGLFT